MLRQRRVWDLDTQGEPRHFDYKVAQKQVVDRLL